MVIDEKDAKWTCCICYSTFRKPFLRPALSCPNCYRVEIVLMGDKEAMDDMLVEIERQRCPGGQHITKGADGYERE